MNFFLRSTNITICLIAATAVTKPATADIIVKKVDQNLNTPPPLDIFKDAKEETVSLMAQPMVAPRPAKTTTSMVFVRAVHNTERIAIAFRWADKELSKAGPIGTFSDAVAIQFPVKDQENPPPVFMGTKDNPVHILHWRAQYEADKTEGKPTIKDIYPNIMSDGYPMEFPDMGTVGKVSEEKREVYSYGKAAGNPQSSSKTGVDEILAEGFGSSSVMDATGTSVKGQWANGEWNVVISRPLKREGASKLPVKGKSFAAFAVWQGGEKEVGSRKSVTMSWMPIIME